MINRVDIASPTFSTRLQKENKKKDKTCFGTCFGSKKVRRTAASFAYSGSLCGYFRTRSF